MQCNLKVVSRIAVILASVLLGTFSPALADVTAACVFEKHRASTALVEYRYQTASDGPGVEKGSGVLVSNDGHILTNAHVIKPRDSKVSVVSSGVSVRMGSATAEPVPAMILLKSDSLDLALLQIPANARNTPAPISSPTELKVGTGLFSIGFPGADATIISGARSAATAISPDIDPVWLQTTLPLNEGNSGGPVFGPLGNVVGIAVAKKKEAQLLSYIIPIEMARPLLASVNLTPVDAGPCAVCRHPAHGIEKFGREFPVTRESGFMGGGHSRSERCDALSAILQREHPMAVLEKTSDGERSESRCPPFNCPQYNYSCTFRVRTDAVYKEVASSACVSSR